MNHVDHIPVGDVAGLGALERAAVLIEEEPQLDQKRRSGRDVERRRFGPPGGARRDRARCRRGDDAEPVQRLVQRTADQVSVQHVAVLREHGSVLEGDRHAVGQPYPLHTHHLGVRLQPERVDLLRARRREPRCQDPRAGHLSPPLHLVAERQEHAGSAVHRSTGDERALPAVAIDESGVGQLLQRLAHRHPADPEPGAQLRLARQRVT